MTQDVKEKWVAALRSGNYNQGTGYLRGIDNRFCCLGVLCDVLFPNEWKENGPSYQSSTAVDSYDKVDRAAGFENDGSWMMSPHASKFVKMNDNAKMTFLEIADHIEETY